jgi:hypothetical protein
VQAPLAPQCVASVCGFTHAPSQLTKPAGHWQLPAVQVSPAAQAVPAVAPVQAPLAPQCVASVCGLTHDPPQFTSPAWQFSRQVPVLHTSPEGQACPHVPQFRLLEETSTQAPPQSCVVPVQSGAVELELPHAVPRANANASMIVVALRMIPALER